MFSLLFRVPRTRKGIGRKRAGIPHDNEEVYVRRDMGRGASGGGSDGGVHCCKFQVQFVCLQESEGRAQTPPRCAHADEWVVCPKGTTSPARR